MAIYGQARALNEGQEEVLYQTSTLLLLDTDFDTPIGTNSTSGMWIPRGNVREAVVAGFSDQASDSSGVLIEQSMDAVTVHSTPWSTTAVASTYLSQVVELTAPYFRARWQNAGVTQTIFFFRVTARR